MGGSQMPERLHNELAALGLRLVFLWSAALERAEPLGADVNLRERRAALAGPDLLGRRPAAIMVVAALVLPTRVLAAEPGTQSEQRPERQRAQRRTLFDSQDT